MNATLPTTANIHLPTTELLQHAEAAGSETDFLSRLIELMLFAVGGSAGLLWQRTEPEAFQLKLASGLDADVLRGGEFAEDSRVVQAQLPSIGQVFRTGQACVAYPAELPADDAGDERSFDRLHGHHRQLMVPVHDRGVCVAVVAIYQPPERESDVERDLLLLGTLCAQVSLWHRHRDCQRLQGELARQRRVATVADAVTRSLDERQTAYEVVNQLRWFFDADRVTLISQRGGACQIAAISGQPLFDRRSNLIRRLEALGQQVLPAGEACWYPPAAGEVAPRLQRRIDAYFEVASTKGIALLPVYRPAPRASEPDELREIIHPPEETRRGCLGLIAIEGIAAELNRELIEQQWPFVERAVTNAIANAREHHGLFLMPVWRALGDMTELFRGRRRNRLLLLGALLVGVLAALVLIPAEFKLRSEGVIQPARRARVYAEVAGTVSELLARDGDWVERGQELLRMSSPEIGLRLAAAEGELREAEEERRTVMLQRLQGEVRQEQQERDLVRLAAALEMKINGLRRQRDLLREKQAKLSLRSPVAGQLVTWDLERRLAGRPVSPGDLLLTVADPRGPWELELRMPDKRAGYLNDTWAKRSSSPTPIRATYVLASDPLRVRGGLVRDVSPSTDVVEQDGNVVRVRVHIEDPEALSARPGTSVIAQVHCGRRSLGYCRLYEFFDWVRRTWFAMF